MEKEQLFANAISTDQMLDFYFNKKKLKIEDFMNDIKEKKLSFWMEIVEFFLCHHLQCEPWYSIIHEAEPIIIDMENQNGLSWILNEFCVDLTHLTGFRGEELQILIVVFEDENTNDLFGKAIQEFKPVQFWHNGMFIGDNLIEEDDLDYNF